MITDIDDTNVILQDDKYYLVPFISNKNIEDLSVFKTVINPDYKNDGAPEKYTNIANFKENEEIVKLMEILYNKFYNSDDLSPDEQFGSKYY